MAKKHQSMQNCNYKTQHSLNNLFLNSLLGLTCSLICSSPYWLPRVKQSLFLSLSSKLSCFLGPKCLFVVVNVIVAFLVGESMFARSSQSSPAGEIYDEYVQRSGSLRAEEKGSKWEVKVAEEKERKWEVKVAEEKERKWEVKVAEERVTPVFEDREVVKEEIKQAIELPIRKDEEVDGDEEMKEIRKEEEGGGEKEMNEEEESGLGTEELNRRVEEFIARVNKQRWLEAKLY